MLSAMLGLSTAGISGLFALWHVWRTGRNAPVNPDASGEIIVLGLKPRANGITRAFEIRLARAASLPTDKGIFILGGVTGPMPTSEAAQAANWLRARGVTSGRLVLEEESVNTRENFAFLKPLLPLGDNRQHILVTSRLHLARSLRLGRGFGYLLEPCGAEKQLRLKGKMWLWLFREAIYFHWLVVWQLCRPGKFR